MQEAIVVMADGMNRYGGSQYVDSSATGRYQAFLADETVAFVDRTYRTFLVARRERCGKSSGGYGALMAGMQRSDVFGAVACHSGTCILSTATVWNSGRRQRDPQTRHGQRVARIF